MQTDIVQRISIFCQLTLCFIILCHIPLYIEQTQVIQEQFVEDTESVLNLGIGSVLKVCS